MKKINIFLACSNELENEKKEIFLSIDEKNQSLKRNNSFFEFDAYDWKRLYPGISSDRIQEYFNDIIRQCNIIIFLFDKKFGIYTEEELIIAYDHLKKMKEEKKKIIFFVYLFIKESSDIEALQKLLKSIEQTSLYYKNVHHLTKIINDSLDRIIPDLKKAFTMWEKIGDIITYSKNVLWPKSTLLIDGTEISKISLPGLLSIQVSRSDSQIRIPDTKNIFIQFYYQIIYNANETYKTFFDTPQDSDTFCIDIPDNTSDQLLLILSPRKKMVKKDTQAILELLNQQQSEKYHLSEKTILINAEVI